MSSRYVDSDKHGKQTPGAPQEGGEKPAPSEDDDWERLLEAEAAEFAWERELGEL